MAKLSRGKTRKKDSSLSRRLTFTLAIFSIILGTGMLLISVSDFSLSLISHKNLSVLPVTAKTMPKPAKLYIPALSRILYISDGEVIDNRWIISNTGVSYLVTSALPGTGGNSVLYGHNRKDILGNLPQLKTDDVIYVVMDNGEFAKYRIFEKKEIEPTQVEILASSSDARLTIYTCSGFLDQARFVVVARLESTSNTPMDF